jgi:hypothetical protein
MEIVMSSPTSAGSRLPPEAHDGRAGATRSDGAAHHATDYSVGYGRPPMPFRFKPGRSGNPKGRPKGSRNLKTKLKEVYTDKISINVGDKKIRITRAEALLLKQWERGIKGSDRATQGAIANAKELGVFEEPKTDARPETDNGAGGFHLSSDVIRQLSPQALHELFKKGALRQTREIGDLLSLDTIRELIRLEETLKPRDEASLAGKTA